MVSKILIVLTKIVFKNSDLQLTHIYILSPIESDFFRILHSCLK